MTRVTRFSFAVAGLATMLVACDSGESEPEDLAAPAIEMNALTAYQTVQGQVELPVTATDDLEVVSVELFVDDAATPVMTATTAPFTLTWDTAAGTDRLANVWARVTDGAGKQAETAPVPVVVLNTGALAEMTDGSSGTLLVGSGDTDVKHHWVNPEGVQQILAIATWETAEGQTEWEIAQTVGKGFCPHDGITLAGAGVTSRVSPIVTISDLADAPLTTTQHFVHLAIANIADHETGDSTPYQITVYLLK